MAKIIESQIDGKIGVMAVTEFIDDIPAGYKLIESEIDGEIGLTPIFNVNGINNINFLNDEAVKTLSQSLVSTVLTPITFQSITGNFFTLASDTFTCIIEGTYTVVIDLVVSTTSNQANIKAGYQANGIIQQGAEYEFDNSNNARLSYVTTIHNCNIGDAFKFLLADDGSGNIEIISGNIVVTKVNTSF